jgi:hypothetical protein
MKFNLILYITSWTRELYRAGRNFTSAHRRSAFHHGPFEAGQCFVQQAHLSALYECAMKISMDFQEASER